MKASSAKTVDEFIAGSPAETRPLLEQIRIIVKDAVPEADETMSYGKPFYKYHGYMVGVTLYAKWLGIEIFDGLSEDDRAELEAHGYVCGSKTFRVIYDQQVPVDILVRLTKAQAKRNESKAKLKKHAS